MATMVTTVPVLQATVSDLKTTIYHESTSRIRAAEQQTATTLQTYRREMNGSLNNVASEFRGSIRNLSLHIGELQSMPTHGAFEEAIRAETRALIDTQTEARGIQSVDRQDKSAVRIRYGLSEKDRGVRNEQSSHKPRYKRLGSWSRSKNSPKPMGRTNRERTFSKK